MTPEPYVPFTQINKAGDWKGLEADLSRAICAKPQAKCEIKQMAWDGLIPSLNENKVDFIIGAFSITDDRRKVVDFSTPYYTEGTSFVGAKSDDAKIATADAPDGSGKIVDPASVSGKIIGVQTSSVRAAYVAKYLKGTEAKSSDTADNSVADLVAGRVDYVTVHFIFQPAEENFGGGQLMIEDGLFERFPCDQVFALHNWPGLATGAFSTRAGPVAASIDVVTITVKGRGGHAARCAKEHLAWRRCGLCDPLPETTVDPVVVGSSVVMALQTLVSRNISPHQPSVVTVGSFLSGTASNIIPDTAILQVSMSAMNAACNLRFYLIVRYAKCALNWPLPAIVRLRKPPAA